MYNEDGSCIMERGFMYYEFKVSFRSFVGYVRIFSIKK